MNDTDTIDADETWMRSIGFLPDDDQPGDFCVSMGELMKGEHTHLIISTKDFSAAIECFDDGGRSMEVVSVGTFKTRDEILKLCQGLKAWIHEPIPPCDGCGRNVQPVSAEAFDDPRSYPKRCSVCNWPLAESASEGCVKGNCSMRPVPGDAR